MLHLIQFKGYALIPLDPKFILHLQWIFYVKYSSDVHHLATMKLEYSDQKPLKKVQMHV